MNLKKELYQQIIDHWVFKNNEIELGLKNLEKSLFNESKSSAGDKYETSRAMIHLEKEKLDLQLINVQNNIKIAKKIFVEKAFDSVKVGSLVKTESFYFYIGITAPKMSVLNHEIYPISSQSPLAKQLLNKKLGDAFSFNGEILEILCIE